jgi:hypothetical protein
MIRCCGVSRRAAAVCARPSRLNEGGFMRRTSGQRLILARGSVASFFKRCMEAFNAFEVFDLNQSVTSEEDSNVGRARADAKK